MKYPLHVAIIPDGNRRWALAHGVSQEVAYTQAAERAKELLTTAQELGIKVFTFWAFSSENWQRDPREVELIMRLAASYLRDGALFERLKAVGGQFHHLGRKDRIPADLAQLIMQLEEESAGKSDFVMNFAFDYGGRDELRRAFARATRSGVDLAAITDEQFSTFLDTAGQPDPDLIIRTSGESRTSGLMPWQASYAELYFAPVFFPDFSAEHLKVALEEYRQRERRQGR